MRHFESTVIVVVALFLVGVGNALAQTPPPQAGAGEVHQIETVIVTANKTEEDLQKIPVSATVVSGTMLDDAKIDDTNELTRFVPNVYMKRSTSENVISMRGVTSFDTSVYSPTAVYVDDLMMPLHYSHLVELMDIERVEVLRGPQGTLYGGNSLAGVINIVTRQPDNEQRFKLYGGLGDYTDGTENTMSYNVGFSGSGPLVEDTLYLALSGKFDKEDGYTTNLFSSNDKANETDHKNLRGILRWAPTASLDISLTSAMLDNDDQIAVYRFDTGPYKTAPYTVNHDNDDYQEEVGHSHSLRVEYDWDAVRLLSVSGIRYYDNENLQDYDVTADPMNNWGGTLSKYDNKLVSQELRLSSKGEDSPFTWLAGVYGFMEETDVRQANAVIVQQAHTSMDTTGYALFGHGTYRFFDRLHAAVGLRYDVRHSKGSKSDIGVRLDDETDSSELLPKFSLGYDVSDDVYCYASVSRGYLAGGYNYALSNDNDSFTYGPEYTWNYEVGLKTSWLNRKLLANLSFFYTQMQDKQVYEVASGANPVTRVDNAAEAHAMGAELEIQARPAHGWDIFAGLGYTAAEYDDWTATEWNSNYTALARTDYGGKTLPNMPEYTANLGVQYRHASGLFARADVNGVGGLYADHGNEFRESPYALVNLQIGYESEFYDVVLFVKNVFNQQYHTVAFDWDGEKMVQDGEPAHFGIRVTMHF